ncbi:hypothetical protein [Streptomyces sp. NPDC058674]|uniref:hypothetical protein n=1 Tax=Streptomyces sp. NPDC058674 TaxID=3346592 RepID=UPI00364BA881
MPQTAGGVITADFLDKLDRPPLAVLAQTSVQSIPNATWGVITFDSEIIDSYSGHSTVSNTSRYTCQVAGTYRITGRVSFAVNGSGSRGARVHKNGNFLIGGANLLGAGTLNGVIEVSHILTLAVSDYVEIAGGHNSGGALSTFYGAECGSMMYVERISS